MAFKFFGGAQASNEFWMINNNNKRTEKKRPKTQHMLFILAIWNSIALRFQHFYMHHESVEQKKKKRTHTHFSIGFHGFPCECVLALDYKTYWKAMLLLSLRAISHPRSQFTANTLFSLFSIPAANAAADVSVKTKDDYSRAHCSLALRRTHTSSGNRDKEGRLCKNNLNYFNEIVLKMPWRSENFLSSVGWSVGSFFCFFFLHFHLV